MPRTKFALLLGTVIVGAGISIWIGANVATKLNVPTNGLSVGLLLLALAAVALRWWARPGRDENAGEHGKDER